MNRGYVKLWRRICDDGLLGHHKTLALFIWMLTKATHEPIDIFVSGVKVALLPGQLVFTRSIAKQDVTLSDQEVRTAKSHLEKLQIITSRATGRFTVISIIKWDIYQAENIKGNQPGNQVSTSRATKSQPSLNRVPTNLQECKEQEEHKEEKNKDSLSCPNAFDSFWSAYPKKTGKLKALESWKKHNPPLQNILAALTWQTKSPKWNEDNGRYIPNPATYLNQGRWMDEQGVGDKPAPAVGTPEYYLQGLNS